MAVPSVCASAGVSATSAAFLCVSLTTSERASVLGLLAFRVILLGSARGPVPVFLQGGASSVLRLSLVSPPLCAFLCPSPRWPWCHTSSWSVPPHPVPWQEEAGRCPWGHVCGLMGAEGHFRTGSRQTSTPRSEHSLSLPWSTQSRREPQTQPLPGCRDASLPFLHG